MFLEEYDKLLDNYYNISDSNKKSIADELSGKAQSILSKCSKEFSLNKLQRNEKIIVSLTSIFERLEYVVYPIQCMLIQTLKPDKIILWLDANKINEELLPEKLLDLKNYGLEIYYVEDIGPHTKYFYAMKTYVKDIIVTIDDDLLYQRTLIEGLVEAHMKNPSCVCAYWVWQMRFTWNGIPYPSSEYAIGDETQNDVPDKNFAALGFGGVLYPPNSLNLEAFNKEKIRKLALKADDVWLKAMEILNNTSVVKAKGKKNYIHIKNSQNVALQHENLKWRNDIIIKKVFEFYNLMQYYKKINKVENLKVKTLLKWIELYQDNLTFIDYFNKRKIRTIAIYGMGQLGKLLLKELENTSIEIKYGIDRRISGIYGTIPIINLENVKEEVDLVIIAAPIGYRELAQYLKFDMISLEDLLVEIVFDVRR